MNLDELLNIARAATPGPWYESFDEVRSDYDSDGTVKICGCFNDKNTAFIAWFNPRLIEKMLAEIAASRAFNSYDKSQALNERQHVRNFYCLKADRDKAREALDLEMGAG